jgi:thiamine pyrophosphate-dependent acetolactate synthase large subunit-like protein
MADGYARTTGRIGVCSVTCGPGLTNAATSLATAANHGSKLLLLAGDTALGDRRNVQRIDQRRISDALGARFLMATSAGAALSELRAALRHVHSGRGPAVLDLPVDVQQSFIDPKLRRGEWHQPVPQLIEPDPIVIKRAAAALAGAQRPVILAGRGAIEASAGVLELAETIGAPVTTTIRAKGLGHGHPLSIGVAGALGDKEASDALQRADVITVFGARLDDWTTSRGMMLENAREVIQIDTDPAILSDSEHPTLPVLADSSCAARSLTALLAGENIRPVPRIVALKTLGASVCECDGLVHPAHAVRALDAALGRDRLVVLDGGHFATFAAQGLTAFDPQRFLFTSDFGAIGQGLGVAIGAAVGADGSRVTAVLGDGCLMMSMVELDTVARLKLPMTIFVMNDQGYGQERHSLIAKGFAPDEASHATPDLVRVAQATGISARRIVTCSELDALPHMLTAADGPLLIDVAIDGNILNPGARDIFERARSNAS